MARSLKVTEKTVKLKRHMTHATIEISDNKKIT